MNDQTSSYLANVINQILHGDQLPSSLAKSLIIPLVKSYRKSMSDPNNYRGISLIPILTKIIEKIIINKCPELKIKTISSYNIYTEDIIDTIQEMNIGTYLPGLINTSIIAFADDLILLSPNLKQLQLMLTECERFGLKNGLRFNDTKTQFVISGKCPIPDPTILLNGKLIAPKDELKHLGFSWSINHTKD